MLLALLFIILTGLCFAIGGEQYFGKGKRGILLSIPLTIYAVIIQTTPYLVLLQFFVLYFIYQCLNYDKGIKMIYEDNNKNGWLNIYFNGALIGLTPICMFIDTQYALIKIIASTILTTQAFWFIIKLSNDKKYSSYRIYLFNNMPIKKVYLKYISINFQDAWYVSCFILGICIAIITSILTWIR